MSEVEIDSTKDVKGGKSPNKKGRKKKKNNFPLLKDVESTNQSLINQNAQSSSSDSILKTYYSDELIPDSSSSFKAQNVPTEASQKKKTPKKDKRKNLNVTEVHVVLSDCETKNRLMNIQTERFDENSENHNSAASDSKAKIKKLNKKKRLRKKSEKTEDDPNVPVNSDINGVPALNCTNQVIKSSEKKKRKVNKNPSVPIKDNHSRLQNIQIKTETDESLSSLNADIGVLDIGKDKLHDDVVPEKISYIPVDSKDFHGILFLSQNQKVAIKGCLHLCVVYGEVEVNGYKLVPGKPYVDIYSVTTSSLFYLQDETHHICNKDMKDQLISVLVTMLELPKDCFTEMLGDIKEIYSCLAVRKLNSVLPAVLMKLNNFRGFTKEPQFLPQPFKTGVLETDCWKSTFNDVELSMDNAKDDCTCSLMFCGAANVGKSSFARYAINRLLGKHESIFFLDCDCGQSEFTPPSVISLVKVTKPLIGLPFSHQVTPVRSFFYGHISPADTPGEYIKLINTLFQTYYVDHYAQGPLVVNTQGWMQGLGLSLLVDVIRMTSPCHIIHIFGHNAKNNVPEELNSVLLKKIKGWDTDMNYKCMKKGHGCTFHNLSTTDTQKTFKPGNKSRIARDQCISSYFSPLYQKYLDSSLLDGGSYENWLPPAISLITPFKVKWKDVALYVMHEKVTPDVMLFGFNLTLVGLARVDPNLIEEVGEDSPTPRYLKSRPLAENIGFGIIRNIDQEKKLFYILTPEPVERLKNVNALLRGGAQLPASYFLEDVESNQPYYCSDYINVATKTAGGMKPRYNLKRKPSKMRNTMG